MNILTLQKDIDDKLKNLCPNEDYQNIIKNFILNIQDHNRSNESAKRILLDKVTEWVEEIQDKKEIHRNDY